MTRVGVTGHQRLDDPEAWPWVASAMREQLAGIAPPLIAMTSPRRSSVMASWSRNRWQMAVVVRAVSSCRAGAKLTLVSPFPCELPYARMAPPSVPNRDAGAHT